MCTCKYTYREIYALSVMLYIVCLGRRCFINSIDIYIVHLPLKFISVSVAVAVWQQCMIGIINSDNKNAFPLYFSHSLSPVLSRFCTSLFCCIPISIYLIRFADYICSLASFDIIYYDILLPLPHSCHVIGANNTLFDIVCGLSMVCGAAAWRGGRRVT